MINQNTTNSIILLNNHRLKVLNEEMSYGKFKRFSIKNHKKLIFQICDPLTHMNLFPSMISAISRVAERDFVEYLESVLIFKKNNLGDIFLNIWLSLINKIDVEENLHVIRSFKELDIHYKADLVVECLGQKSKNKYVLTFEAKLDGYFESENQTIKQEKYIKNVYRNNEKLIFIFLDSKGLKAENQSFINTNLLPIIKTIEEVKSILFLSKKKDLYNLNLFYEVARELHRRGKHERF